VQVVTYTFQPHGDDRGQLIALEEMSEVPFAIRRVYYLYDTKAGVRRGLHAHKHLEQVLVCVNGSCKVLLDDGSEQTVVSLETPGQGLYIASDIWREMYDFSSDAVLLVLASERYNEADYIRDYDAFLEHLAAKETDDE
jgi:dTDP-4-dehydrorhamnose 3,5-epimerase-like enzyme